jgi:hypothetical protein
MLFIILLATICDKAHCILFYMLYYLVQIKTNFLKTKITSHCFIFASSIHYYLILKKFIDKYTLLYHSSFSKLIISSSANRMNNPNT